MEITQIEHFVTIATTGSYGRASTELNVTQSALSKSVKRLEQYLSAPLFERTSRGVRLTPHGEALLPHCREILNERKRAVAMVTALNGDAAGNVKIGVSKHLSDVMLPTVLSRVLTENPRYSIEVQSGYFPELIVKLSNADLDIVLGSCNAQDVGPNIAFEKLRNNDSIAVTRPIAGKPGAPPQVELDRRRWIISATPQTVAGFQRRRSGTGQVDPPPVVTNSAALTRALVSTGDFITICSRASVQREVAAGELVELNLPVRGSFPSIGLLTRKKGHKPPAVQAVIQAFRRAARGG